LRERILNQAARELLLAQASDWPFMITNGTTEKYGRRRFHDHLNRFHGLLNSLDPAEVPPSPDNVPLLACPAVRSAPPRNGTVDERRLACLEYMDAIFPKIDYRVFARAEQTPAV
jgi:1,4-alpha-glucan branching enzyme